MGVRQMAQRRDRAHKAGASYFVGRRETGSWPENGVMGDYSREVRLPSGTGRLAASSAYPGN